MKTIYEWHKKPEVPAFLENVLNNTTKCLLSKKVVYSNSAEIAKELVNYLEQYLYIAILIITIFLRYSCLLVVLSFLILQQLIYQYKLMNQRLF